MGVALLPYSSETPTFNHIRTSTSSQGVNLPSTNTTPRNPDRSADVLQLLTIIHPWPQLRLEHPPEQLEQDLEAGFGDGRVVAPLAQLVADESVLGPGELVPAEDAARGPQRGADQVPPGVGDVGVADAEDEGGFGPEEGEVVERVRGGSGGGGWGRGGGVRPGVGAEGAGVDICWEVGCCCCYAGVELVLDGFSAGLCVMEKGVEVCLQLL